MLNLDVRDLRDVFAHHFGGLPSRMYPREVCYAWNEARRLAIEITGDADGKEYAVTVLQVGPVGPPFLCPELDYIGSYEDCIRYVDQLRQTTEEIPMETRKPIRTPWPATDPVRPASFDLPVPERVTLFERVETLEQVCRQLEEQIAKLTDRAEILRDLCDKLANEVNLA